MRSLTIRTAVCFMGVLSLFLVCIIRIMMITSSAQNSAVGSFDNTLSVTVSTRRGNIFDRNGECLTEIESETVALITPCEESINYVSSVLNGDQRETVLETLNKGKPTVIKTSEPLYCVGITNIEVPKRNTEDLLCKHLIGYTDYQGHGVVGLEKLFDDELYTNSKITARFFTSAYGSVLSGIEPEITNDTSISSSGIMTTIDRNIQYLTQKAAKDIKKGAVVVSEASSGKIRAMVSLPDYDINNIAAVLDDKDSPLINRCLLSYNVGSAFKPLLAAAALEKGGLSKLTYECSGSVTIEGNIFNCHDRSGHGIVDMKDALKLSCNSYFYRFCEDLGGETIYNAAKLFSFGNRQTLFEGLTTKNEQITALETLQNSKSALANLSIGQGELLASPITLLSLYEAIACGGVYHQKTVIEGKVEDGILTEKYPEGEATRALSKETADILKEFLCEVVESGTGIKARPDTVTAAGKTATAQTGQKNENGDSLEHSWFCGFFPAEEPKYVVCVLIEDASTSDITAAEVFKSIADYVNSLE